MTRPLQPEALEPPAGTGVAVRLRGGRCDDCERPHFPAAERCPWCGSDATTGISLSSTGRLWGWTTVTTAPPGYDGPVPFGFGVVELPEALRVVTRLAVDDTSDLEFGQVVELVVETVAADDDGTELTMWAFAPIAT